jgi:hypothetical protein
MSFTKGTHTTISIKARCSYIHRETLAFQPEYDEVRGLVGGEEEDVLMGWIGVHPLS